jgi:hypothetical protein
MRLLGLDELSDGFDMSKPTGKELFLNELAGDEALATASPTSPRRPPLDAQSSMEISEDLFDDDDEDLGDLEDDEDDEGEEEVTEESEPDVDESKT